MTHEEFVKLQQAQLEIMDEIHRICVQEDIPYYMIGGTALGAIRHGGFIPWDVDIDIAMYRADYDRFKQACSRKLNQKFRYWDYQNTPNYIRPHALVSMRGTSLSTVYDSFNSRVMDFGIFVDIFSLDNAPDQLSEREAHGKAIRRLKLMKEHKMAQCFDSSKLKKIVKEIIRLLMVGVTIDGLNAKLDHEMRKYNDRDTAYACTMGGKYSYLTECVPKAYLGTPTLIPFEGRQYYAPEQLDNYLTHVYGDYHKLPPEEARQESANYFQHVRFFDDNSAEDEGAK